ncbi:MAG: hypothetical protein PF542_01390 [Nanoarchaeota archaeon]|jgi:hypothetical protein|nr:hypothetical protein [Nanoarchaeota archaeon]
MEKRGQMKMSFGMIMSIILVIMFLVFAFFAIKKFLGFQETVKTKQFLDNLQGEVDKMYKSTYGSKQVSYSAPSNMEKLCFFDMDKNVLLELKGGPYQKNIDHLNMEAILNGKDQLCATVENGKVALILEKKYGENLVTIRFPNE